MTQYYVYVVCNKEIFSRALSELPSVSAPNYQLYLISVFRLRRFLDALSIVQLTRIVQTYANPSFSSLLYHRPLEKHKATLPN